MSGSTFGKIFRLTTYGESHGPGLGGIVDGCPSGIALDEALIQAEVDRRKPGGGVASTARRESDIVSILSGVFQGRTTGTPIGFAFANEDQRSRDYGGISETFRPGHADYPYQAKYGMRDYRGGGRASGRETVCRVAGGAVAGALLATLGVRVRAYPVELGGIRTGVSDLDSVWDTPFFAPDPEVVARWEARVREVKARGDSIGGVVQVEALGVPPGLGEPVFDKLDATLAHAVMSVGAVKAVEIGSGIEAARLLGSENNDSLLPGEGPDSPDFASNHAGGIVGGVSSGQSIVIRATVKPIPSIAKEQQTINVKGEPIPLSVGGRHDVSAIPRIVPVLRAMVLLALADAWLLQQRFSLNGQ
jgi:chorismate synthase